MFEKKTEFKILDKYSKVYKSEYNIVQIVEMIQNSQYLVEKIVISDDAHIGLKMFGGEYSFNGFYDAFKSYGSSIESVIVYFSDIPVSMKIYDNGDVSMISSNKDIELSDIVTEKKKDFII